MLQHHYPTWYQRGIMCIGRRHLENKCLRGKDCSQWNPLQRWNTSLLTQSYMRFRPRHQNRYPLGMQLLRRLLPKTNKNPPVSTDKHLHQRLVRMFQVHTVCTSAVP